MTSSAPSSPIAGEIRRGLDVDRERRRRERELAQVDGDGRRRAAVRRSGGPSTARAPRARPRPAPGAIAASRRGRARVVLLELLEPRARSSRVLDDVGQRRFRTFASTRRAARGASAPPAGAPGRRRRLPRSSGRRARPPACRPGAAAGARPSATNGARPSSAATAAPSASSPAPSSSRYAAASASRCASASASSSASANSRSSSPRVDDRGRVDLVDLVAEQVDLAGSRPFVAAERRRAPPRSHARPARAAPRAVRALTRLGTGEPVEERALLGRREERLVRVLTVQVDEPAPAFRELGHRGEAAVHVAPRPTVGRDDAREHDLVVTVVEASFDARLRRTLRAPAVGRRGRR